MKNWDMYRAVIPAVYGDVYWEVDKTKYQAVNRAANRSMYGIVNQAVYDAVYLNVYGVVEKRKKPHPGLAFYLKEVG